MKRTQCRLLLMLEMNFMIPILIIGCVMMVELGEGWILRLLLPLQQLVLVRPLQRPQHHLLPLVQRLPQHPQARALQVPLVQHQRLQVLQFLQVQRPHQVAQRAQVQAQPQHPVAQPVLVVQRQQQFNK